MERKTPPPSPVLPQRTVWRNNPTIYFPWVVVFWPKDHVILNVYLGDIQLGMLSLWQRSRKYCYLGGYLYHPSKI